MSQIYLQLGRPMNSLFKAAIRSDWLLTSWAYWAAVTSLLPSKAKTWKHITTVIGYEECLFFWSDSKSTKLLEMEGECLEWPVLDPVCIEQCSCVRTCPACGSYWETSACRPTLCLPTEPGYWCRAYWLDWTPQTRNTLSTRHKSSNLERGHFKFYIFFIGMAGIPLTG